MNQKLISLDDGFGVLINKPLDWTSFDVVNRLRGVLSRCFDRRKIKVGHAGTLDPKATGLLIVCVGKHTKKIQAFQDLDKTYTGSFYIGATTPTYDSESEPNDFFSIDHIDKALLEDTRQLFLGEIDQIPPIFSAVKKEGIVAYKAARSGKKIELDSRKVKIKSFKLSNCLLPHVDFEVVCSKGTYIRSLAHDFGKSLRSGAYLAELKRTAIGPYNLNNAWELTDFVQLIESTVANKNI